ncbi:tRNA wybutosine-synthesizing protein 2 homolog [Paramacrobiotus metropolitanus]|uniref:tRNA wybutosine-synthesizing protein 2 homolog n=1 Tax=Paramacrobiotus metropolitanus TaxID=2943436 RepID=UPI0024463A97|nr:tRNA wybutosine-synthesizing protein 2 homolog [Paramacrobiotus metropolitanus]
MSKKKTETPHARLRKSMQSLLEEYYLPVNGALDTFPRHWEIFGDLILFPEDAFTADCWRGIQEKVYDAICTVFKVSRIARHGRILPGDYRSPQAQMLRGTCTWVRKKDNGIIYEFDLMSCMFSSGNITEKIRMSTLACQDECIVDLFSGIGYFTIPLLKAGAKWVYACEWNPASVEALKRNLRLNGVEKRCEILFGDNRKMCPVNVADRVVLGLIPSSELSWETACKALRSASGGILHVHMNVEESDASDLKSAWNAENPRITFNFSVHFKLSCFKNFAVYILSKLVSICDGVHGGTWTGHLLHLEVVKSYGPKIYHCVYDVKMSPTACLGKFL